MLSWCLAAALTFLAGQAQSFELAPFKDRLFAYPGILESRDGGAYLIVDYDEVRDINRRDQVPERRVKRKYVDLSPRRRQSDQVLQTSAGEIRFIAVGDPRNARIVTMYVHGRGGDRKQGTNDYTFGGNFNRIKNLMLRNNGIYIAPDGGELDEAAAQRIRHLVLAVLRQLREAKIVLACGSAGGTVCHALAGDDAIAARMAGMALLGSFGDESFIGSAAWRHRVPLLIAHGAADSVIPFANAESFYRALRDTPGYPVRLVRFETGGHGTPIRMTDWRETINWMLAAR
ncbi:prolyl oligopeptidase family serine peptidase [Oricola thermophila]|uniref:Prolyl oligopeptidase family serine peptidase n=2 Tax=Oricola thermophila TaxID=2742145 RepID=A0A6N1VIC2_9HYPH|nr:prolyl oligopeptidase family serine peptidase [Oricola thermophila]